MSKYIVGVATENGNNLVKVEADSALDAAKLVLYGQTNIADPDNQYSTLEKLKRFAYDTEILISTPYQLP